MSTTRQQERLRKISGLLEDGQVPNDRISAGALLDLALQTFVADPDSPWEKIAALVQRAADDAKKQHTPKVQA